MKDHAVSRFRLVTLASAVVLLLAPGTLSSRSSPAARTARPDGRSENSPGFRGRPRHLHVKLRSALAGTQARPSDKENSTGLEVLRRTAGAAGRVPARGTGGVSALEKFLPRGPELDPARLARVLESRPPVMNRGTDGPVPSSGGAMRVAVRRTAGSGVVSCASGPVNERVCNARHRDPTEAGSLPQGARTPAVPTAIRSATASRQAVAASGGAAGWRAREPSATAPGPVKTSSRNAQQNKAEDSPWFCSGRSPSG
ncbi:hypothetical protein SAMN04489730_4893 [Amycolatopsis australiensis]|uniref:Uncharacterized protein n=1 Tax=Amycolatopsis australiensis TaxID=546364 RepID=A0A1K1S6T7_9PSEU|nr:hypothetical protein SAMN04489730_4893 [Amycolatopsis australiensis]